MTAHTDRCTEHLLTPTCPPEAELKCVLFCFVVVVVVVVVFHGFYCNGRCLGSFSS